jgi:hypothetical protein
MSSGHGGVSEPKPHDGEAHSLGLVGARGGATIGVVKALGTGVRERESERVVE